MIRRPHRLLPLVVGACLQAIPVSLAQSPAADAIPGPFDRTSNAVVFFCFLYSLACSNPAAASHAGIEFRLMVDVFLTKNEAAAVGCGLV